MLFEQMQRQITTAVAREAQRRADAADKRTPPKRRTPAANDNTEACVLVAAPVVIEPVAQDVLGPGTPEPEPELPEQEPVPEPEHEPAPAAKANDTITCGVALTKAAHAELRRRAAINKTTIKQEALKAILRDM